MATTLWIHPDNKILSTVKQEDWTVFTSDLSQEECLKNLLPEEVWVSEDGTLYSSVEAEGFKKK